jgi:RNA polymerase sigma-70 factor (ECF subfamily)
LGKKSHRGDIGRQDGLANVESLPIPPQKATTVQMADTERTKQFVEMLTAHQRDMYAYVNMLMAGDSAAADVVQDTNVDLWAKLDDFDFDRPFLPWALRFAYHRVLAYRKTRSRSRLVFSDAFVEALSHDYLQDPVGVDKRLKALQTCLDRLGEDHRQLIHDRYTAGISVKSIAARMGGTAGAVSAQLYRVRRILAKCVESRVAREGC